MSDQPDDPANNEKPGLCSTRRRFLGGLAAISAGGALASCAPTGATLARPAPLTSGQLDKALRNNIKTVVVIYAENRSFNNLFADFPGTEKPLSALKPSDYQQRDRDGSLLANAPFPLKGPQGEDLPMGLVTRDLWHVFYQNQMQINGGRNDKFVAWADSGGLTMGYYPQSRYALRLWDLAEEFVLCDNFFQGAFGGSFLNHQYLISATAPVYPNASGSVARSQIATLMGDDPTDTQLKPLPASPASAMQGPPQFGPSALTPDGYAVNTLAPPYWPTWIRDPQRPDYSKPDLPNVLVPQRHEHIGDKLSRKGVDWAWYAGGWQATLEQFKDSPGIPKIPNFQYHHQPFNYFVQQGPEHPEERQRRLRDGGLGDDPSSNHFLADAAAGKLPAMTFYKPQGNLNMHAGYADVTSGDRHIVTHRQNPEGKPSMAEHGGGGHSG